MMKVSVIVPIYNAEKSIQRCLESVFEQTYSGKLEIILVNDGSTDQSENLIKQIIDQRASSTIELKLITQANGGVSKARNAGLKVSIGEYIAFLDADDEWYIDKLEKQISIFEKHKHIDFLATSITDKCFDKSASAGSLTQIPFSKLIYKNYFQPSTVVMKREVFNSIGFFNEAQKYAEEGNYFMRIAKHFNCYLLNEKLIVYGDGKEGFGVSGLSANLKEMEKGELMNLRFAYDQGFMGKGTYVKAYIFSVLKYIRRLIIVNLR